MCFYIMIQDIVIYIIGMLIVAWLCYKLYRFVFVKKGQVNKCAGCPGCDLKNLLEKSSSSEECRFC